MNRHQCPHCSKNSITGIRSMFLGPVVSTTCSEFGGRVSVPYWSLAALAPLIVAICLMPLVRDNGLYSFWLGAIGTMGLFVLWGEYVPLVKR